MSKKETPLYVKLPSAAGDKLDRAAEALGVTKKDLVAGLVDKYLDPSAPRLGSYSFQAYDATEPPEVMTAEQAAQFLQIEEKLVLEMAEAGKLPGRKLGKVWRFSRTALVQWLATP
jgi:excisionase family DNA binding protein